MFRILFSVAASLRWWILLAVTVFLGTLFVGYVRANETDAIRAALEENFAAYNAEDVPRMMRSLSPTLPDRDDFERQASKFFKDNDAYISIKDFEVLEVRPPYATARVVQGTLPAEGAPEPSEDEAYYRENSKLLPSEEEVEYVQAFKKERGKWRLWLIMTAPKTPYVGYTDDGVYHGPNAKVVNAKNGITTRSHCPDGNCGFPRVRVSAQ
jgi:hypothetical protein